MSKDSYDVAIVGAGPAGCTAAKVATQNGLKTIVFDGRKQIGKPVQCGEFLPIPEELKNIFPNSARIARLANVPKKFITNRTSQLMLSSPSNHQFEFSFISNIIDRAKYDPYLAEQAKTEGAEIHLQTTVIRRTESNQLILRNKSGRQIINAKVIIGADGAQSRIAQSLGACYQNKIHDLSPAIQFVMANIECDLNTTEMYFGHQIAPGGYAWVIPKSETMVNIGLGFRRAFAFTSENAFSYLQRFISSHPANVQRMKKGKILRKSGAIIPMGGPISKTYSDSVLLVGDAAGHVMASNGGGIPTALGGGELAGIAAAQHIHQNQPLSWYEAAWKNEFGQELSSALDVLRVADKIIMSDNLTDLCMRLAGPRYLQQLIRCRLPFPVRFASKTFVKILAFLS